MRAGKCFRLYGLQNFETLFIMPFLYLQHALHEFHLIGKSGVGECLQIGLEVTLELFVPSIEPFG